MLYYSRIFLLSIFISLLKSATFYCSEAAVNTAKISFFQGASIKADFFPYSQKEKNLLATTRINLLIPEMNPSDFSITQKILPEELPEEFNLIIEIQHKEKDFGFHLFCCNPEKHKKISEITRSQKHLDTRQSIAAIYCKGHCKDANDKCIERLMQGTILNKPFISNNCKLPSNITDTITYIRPLITLNPKTPNDPACLSVFLNSARSLKDLENAEKNGSDETF